MQRQEDILFRTKKTELGFVCHGSGPLLQRKEEPELVKPKKIDFIDYMLREEIKTVIYYVQSI